MEEYKRDIMSFCTASVIALSPGMDPSSIVAKAIQMANMCNQNFEVVIRETLALFEGLKNEKMIAHCHELLAKYASKGEA